jgi:hypothetical protein
MKSRNQLRPYHKNIRRILDLCWQETYPDFYEQMKRTWITEFCLCSAKKALAKVEHPVEKTCGEHYLREQIMLIKERCNAKFIALGKKAELRTKKIDYDCWSAYAAAPPACWIRKNEANESWDKVAKDFRQFLNGDSMT